MKNVTSADLDASFDSLSMTAMQVKAERDALETALNAILCPECDHTLKQHADIYGCEYDRGDGYIGDAEFLQALGPCGCQPDAKLYPDIHAAIEVLRRVK